MQVTIEFINFKVLLVFPLLPAINIDIKTQNLKNLYNSVKIYPHKNYLTFFNAMINVKILKRIKGNHINLIATNKRKSAKIKRIANLRGRTTATF